MKYFHVWMGWWWCGVGGGGGGGVAGGGGGGRGGLDPLTHMVQPPCPRSNFFLPTPAPFFSGYPTQNSDFFASTPPPIWPPPPAHFLSKAPPTPIPMLPSRMQQCCFNVMCILVFTKYFLFLYHCSILSKIKLTTATCKSLYSVSLPGLWRFVRWLWYLPVNHVGWSGEIAKQNNISKLCHHWFR